MSVQTTILSPNGIAKGDYHPGGAALYLNTRAGSNYPAGNGLAKILIT